MLELAISVFLLALCLCFAFAAWPVVLAPAFRALRIVLGGSFCISLGTGIVALRAASLPAATTGGRLFADETDVKALKAEADPIIGDNVIEIPDGRPGWIGQPPAYSGKTHTVAVASGPYATNKESLRALDQALVKAMNEYVSEQLNSDLAARLITFDARTIKRRFVKDSIYHDEAKYSVGKMHENFALLQFDTKFRTELGRRWNQVRANSRLLQTGVFAGAALLVLGSVFSYFRADSATRGRYCGRLQFMTATALVAVAGASVLAFRFIPWL
jgi:hypothetical protein